jgi:hypothetical protein
VNGVEAIQLVIELLVRIRQDVVFLVGGQHEVGQGASDAIEQQPTLFAFLRLDILGVILSNRQLNKRKNYKKQIEQSSLPNFEHTPSPPHPQSVPDSAEKALVANPTHSTTTDANYPPTPKPSHPLPSTTNCVSETLSATP